MGISTLVVLDINRFVGMRDFWDRQLRDHVDDPFLFSSMIIEHFFDSEVWFLELNNLPIAYVLVLKRNKTRAL